MKKAILAVMLLADFGTGQAAEWRISAAYPDGDFARVVIETTTQLRVRCALKNKSGTTIAAQPWMVAPPATEVLVRTHGRAWETASCSAQDYSSSPVRPDLRQEPDAELPSSVNGFPTDGKNPVLNGDRDFSMTDSEWFAWSDSGIHACETIPIYGFDGSDWPTVLKWAQIRLTALGYDPGEADGKDGPKTRAALQAFAADHGMTQDGRWLEQHMFAALIPGKCFVPKVAHILECNEAISSDPGWKLQQKMLQAGRGEDLLLIQQEASKRCHSKKWTPKQVEQYLAEKLDALH